MPDPTYPTKAASWNTYKANFDRRIEALEAWLSRAGITFHVASKDRSMANQAMTYAQGRTTPGPIISNAKAGQSPHNWGLARDYVLVHNGHILSDPNHHQWRSFETIVQACHLMTGRHFKRLCDAGHVEHPTWKRAIAWRPPK